MFSYLSTFHKFKYGAATIKCYRVAGKGSPSKLEMSSISIRRHQPSVYDDSRHLL